jgi:hypothetical protein
MKLPSHFLIPIVIASTCSVTFLGFAQQRKQVVLPTNAWAADEELSDHMTRKLKAFPAYIDYLVKCQDAIIATPIKDKGSRRNTMIDARFMLGEDGTVKDIEISGATNAPVAPRVIKAIRSCSPFPKWPSGMLAVVGKPYLRMYMHFGFNMKPPDPG